MRLLLCLACLALLASIARADDGWLPVANKMTDGRWAPAAAVLPGGTTAIIAGGYSYATGRCVSSADLFDARTCLFRPAQARLLYPRDFATATPLPDGRILIAGGYDTLLGTLDTAEAYDPRADTFTLIPSPMAARRELFQATALRDGRILLTGGFDTHRGHTLASAELFDPTTNVFTPLTSTLHDDRFGHASVRLNDGRVLIVGGTHWHVREASVPLVSAEIFDPITEQFHSASGVMAVPRDRPTATLLLDGRVLIAGGQNGSICPPQAELFDPKTETFTTLPAPLLTPRMAHSDLTLPDGRVLLVGGWSASAQATTPRAEMYDPRTQAFSPAPTLPGGSHDLALLQFANGLILAAGGKQVGGGTETSLATGAVWQPSILAQTR